MAYKHRKRCSALLAIRKIQIKTMWYHYILIRISKLKIVTTPNASEDAKQLDHSYITG